MTWHPARGEETAQELEHPLHAGGRRHAGRRRSHGLGAGRRPDFRERGHYNEGWGSVLGRFVEAAGKES